MNKAKELLLDDEDDSRLNFSDNPTVWTDAAVHCMIIHAIEFGEWLEKNTYPAGGGKFLHREYLKKGPKFRKEYTVRQLYKRFNSGK